MCGTQVLFIEMTEERHIVGDRERSCESVRKLAKCIKAFQNVSILDESVSIRGKAGESFMKT
ncbi:hypothetical protein DPMN_141218 [Dreissena polymorpha]|uniref:Uncharacterized protein n=1 Tax=Dreissena polymorpha TaxID=45954 RepID=A0A9D4JL27_DREPO|nr:hypothetical protein DPMN_141218 [Dreissena polymorpha]